MAYKRLSMVLKRDELVSDKPFAINGTYQILCSMPQGVPWGTRTVVLEYLSPHEGDQNDLKLPNQDWRPVQDPETGDELYKWERNEGFLEVEGTSGILYRLRTTAAGCQASLWTIRKYISGKPGR